MSRRRSEIDPDGRACLRPEIVDRLVDLYIDRCDTEVALAERRYGRDSLSAERRRERYRRVFQVELFQSIVSQALGWVLSPSISVREVRDAGTRVLDLFPANRSVAERLEGAVGRGDYFANTCGGGFSRGVLRSRDLSRPIRGTFRTGRGSR